ncbi:MAG: carbohydrate kinase [Clostridia bacterium]|nr:carbohydrate kinase [Clostridia bacterium]
MKYFLGIDNGGTVTKAALFDQTGREIAVASRDTPVLTPQAGWNERDMEELWQTNVTCIREVLHVSGIPAKQIAGVGCTGHGKGLYLWGKDGKPAYHGIASTDRRASYIVDQWERDGTVALAYRQTLQPVLACQPVALLRWMQENKPDILERVQWVFECKDYIRFRLTGVALAEETDYSGTCLMDLTTRCFDRELLKVFGLEKLYGCLPPLCKAWDHCGSISAQAAAFTGLEEGTTVCGGMFDIDACAVAVGVTQPQDLCMITGTWSINEYPSPKPVLAEVTTKNSLFCLPELYLIEESSPTSAGNLDWVLDRFMKKEKEQIQADGVNFYQWVDQTVKALPTEECDVLYLPFLYGTGTSVKNAALVGLSNSHTQAHILRAVFEGVAFSHRMHLEKLLHHRPEPKTVRLAGGAARSQVWGQIFADVLQLPVEIVDAKELGTLGCAMAASVAAGVYADAYSAVKAMMPRTRVLMPDTSKAAVYKKKYLRYERLCACLEEF